MTYQSDAAAVGTAADVAIAAQQALVTTRQGTVATKTATLNAKQVELAALLGTNPPPTPEAEGGLLSWGPPVGYKNFTVKNIPVGGGTLNLTNGVDYLLVAPTQPITGTVIINGGRHVVWIGGVLGGRKTAPALTSSYDGPNRGIRINSGAGSPDRIIFIEGIKAEDGTFLSDFIQVYTGGAPTSGLSLYVQNCRIEAWTWGNNQTSPNVHADVIQFYSGPTNFFCDGLTAKSVTYQGLYLDARNFGGTPGGAKVPWQVKRVNLQYRAGTGQPSSQPLGLNTAASWANVQNSEIYTSAGFKSVASFGGWPRNAELHENATPPGGDFVPATFWVGNVYTSPGYVN